MWISMGDGFILLFAINDEESFKALQMKYEKIIKEKKGKCPMILVGNKQDLEYDRKVGYREAKTQADLWGIEYIETSVKTNYNVDEAFENLAKSIIQMKYKKNNSKGKHCRII